MMGFGVLIGLVESRADCVGGLVLDCWCYGFSVLVWVFVE